MLGKRKGERQDYAIKVRFLFRGKRPTGQPFDIEKNAKACSLFVKWAYSHLEINTSRMKVLEKHAERERGILLTAKQQQTMKHKNGGEKEKGEARALEKGHYSLTGSYHKNRVPDRGGENYMVIVDVVKNEERGIPHGENKCDLGMWRQPPRRSHSLLKPLNQHPLRGNKARVLTEDGKTWSRTKTY